MVRFIPFALFASAACAPGNDITAVDCYGTLPIKVGKLDDKRFQATPTKPGAVLTDQGVVEQFQVAYQRQPDKTKGLLEDALGRLVGIAYDPGEADPTAPGKSWDPDLVFDVSLSDRLGGDVGDPLDPDQADLDSHFDGTGERIFFAFVALDDPAATGDLDMVLASEGCTTLVPSADGVWDHPLVRVD